MLTGFEALGAASAVLQVISFATDVVVACKKAYDGATTSEDDLHRHAKQMSEAVERVKSRCGKMTNTNASFSNPELKTISQDCIDAARELEAQVGYVTSLQAKGDIRKAFRKAFRTFRRKKKLEDLEKSMFRYKQLIDIELQSHLCSRNEAIRLKQESAFQKLDADVKSLVNQLAQGVTDVQNLVKHEHTTTRSAITQEVTRVEVAINSHTDSQVLELRTTGETSRKCEVFLQSLKAPRMNQRYNDVMDSRDASFNQVFATYEEMIDMYRGSSEESGYSTDDVNSENTDDSEDDIGDDAGEVDSEGYGPPEATRYGSDIDEMEHIYDSWLRFNSWLRSDDKLFYIQGKPGSGKSTLVKFILDQDQTRDLLKEWSPDTVILSYFFWKIGSEEQNSIKGLWCSLLYQRLQYQQHLIFSTLKHFRHLSLHSEYYDWSVKDLQAVWNYVVNLDTRHICIFVDGLDEIRDKDGFSELAQSIQLISRLARIKLCVSTRPEAQIMRWIKTTNAEGILLEELTRFDMLEFVREKLSGIPPASHLCQGHYGSICQRLVTKAQGVFLWLHLATRSIIQGIENRDSEDMLSERLLELPADLEKLYVDMWERLNAKSSIYRETARRYFRYVLHCSKAIEIEICLELVVPSLPLLLQIACAENTAIQQSFLMAGASLRGTDILQMCDDTAASIYNRCAGLLEIQPQSEKTYGSLGDDITVVIKATSEVAFIHRTAHDFLTETEAGQDILGYDLSSDLPWKTRLLKGLICMVQVMISKWDTKFDFRVLEQIFDDAAKLPGTEGLQMATKMLDFIRPLFDDYFATNVYPWEPHSPFLRFLVDKEFLDEYVISVLTSETTPHLATSILREGWHPNLHLKLDKRKFDALIVLGADPHEYGVLGHSLEVAPLPFIVKGTAFTNLLTHFLVSTQAGLKDRGTEGSETLEIAIHMAGSCQDLTAPIVLFICFSEAGHMEILPSTKFKESLGCGKEACPLLAVYEVNLQLLLLCLLSKVGENLVEGVQASRQAQDVLARIDNPSVKIRYFRKVQVTEGNSEQDITSPIMFRRVTPLVPSLSGSDIDHLFGTSIGEPSQNLCVPDEDKTGFQITDRYIKDLETEEVNAEDMMVSLAAENMGFCTFEEAGITLTSEQLREVRERDQVSWVLCPLSMRRIEQAATMKEAAEGPK